MAGDAGDVPVRFGALSTGTSTVKQLVAGVGSVPPAKVARTREGVRAVGQRARGVWEAPGPEQGTKVPASMRAGEGRAADREWKPKVGVESLVGPLGPESIVVCGGVVVE